ncbi:MAG TPA: 2-oxoglutarate and iron-dependent oxygenase domain-containing protein [Acidimicrobiales bacterium]
MDALPVIDVGPIIDGGADDAVAEVGRQVDAACRDLGFFVVVGHGVPAERYRRLVEAARSFFALPEATKGEIAMARAGRAWRGWFPVGGELTSGVPDGKEGLYFGAELPPNHPRVRAGTPLHGANLFPAVPADLQPAVLEHLDAMTALGHSLMEAVALGLGLERDWFRHTLTTDPTILFRIFHYPPSTFGASGGDEPPTWGVAEHTDYGLLTILGQDDHAGLEVRTSSGWLVVPPIPGAFVCNIGDMLDRITAGRYRSTPHRVRPPLPGDPGRLSFPFFFDPSWDARVLPLPLDGSPPADDVATRWDGTSVHAPDVGTYGDYLTGRVAKVFPDLMATPGTAQ